MAMQSTPVKNQLAKGSVTIPLFFSVSIIPLLMAHIDNVSELHDMSTG